MSLKERIKKWKQDPYLTTYYFDDRPNKLYVMDTTLNNVHYHNFAQRSGFEYYNIGNSGTATFPILYSPRWFLGFDMGYHSFDIYRLSIKDISYFYVKRPIIDFKFVAGTRREQQISVLHSQNIKKIFNYGFHFQRLFAPGTIPNQPVNNNSFTLYGRLQPKNNRYALLTNLAFNKINVRENGGLNFDYLNLDTTRFLPGNLTTNLSNAVNEHLGIDYDFRQTVHLGKKHLYFESEEDTVGVYKVLPLFELSYLFSVGRERYTYQDFAPDSLFYLNYFSAQSDTLLFFSKYRHIGNQFSFKYTGLHTKKTSGIDSAYYRNIEAYTSIKYQNIEIDLGSPNTLTDTGITTNLFQIDGGIRSNDRANSHWVYHVWLGGIVSGYNQGDVLFDASFSYSLKRKNILGAQFSFNQYAPNLLYRHFRSEGFRWDNSFSKTKKMQFNIHYSLSHPRITLSTKALYYLMKNQIYFSSNRIPRQFNSFIHLAQFRLSTRFNIKGFHWNSLIGIQYTNNNSIVPIPLFYTKQQVFYQRRIFKQVLLFQLGAEVRYNTNYFAQGYIPQVSHFHVQEQSLVKQTPILDLFLNIEVKTVRLSLKLNNVLFNLVNNGQYTAYLYPYPSRYAFLGINWRFFD